MKKIGIIICLATLMLACHKPKSSITTVESTSKTDSIIYKETVRQVPVLIPGDSIPFMVEIPCPNIDTTKEKPIHYKSKNNRASIDLTYDKGVLKGVCNCDEWIEWVSVQDTYIKQLEATVQKTTSESIEIIAKYDRWFWYLLLWFIGSIVAIVLTIYLKLKP